MYMKDYEWLKDELSLAASIMRSPISGANSPEEKIGAYMATHRAAVIVMDGIIDALDEVIEAEKEEDF